MSCTGQGTIEASTALASAGSSLRPAPTSLPRVLKPVPKLRPVVEEGQQLLSAGRQLVEGERAPEHLGILPDDRDVGRVLQHQPLLLIERCRRGTERLHTEDDR